MTEQPSSVDAVARAVDEAPFRPLHLWLFLAATGGTLLDGMSVFMTGLAVPLLRDEFAIGPVEVGLLGSALVLGAVAGAVIGGHLSDRLGRKDVFLGDMALLAVAALVLVLAPSVGWILAGQFLLGATLGTFLLPELRASLGTSAMLLVLAGVSIAGCLVTVLFRPREAANAVAPLRR